MKAKTTTTHELIPHMLTLKNMTAVVIIKRNGDQFDYDDVSFDLKFSLVD